MVSVSLGPPHLPYRVNVTVLALEFVYIQRLFIFSLKV